MSVNMMKRAGKNCSECNNIVFRKANIMSINAKDDTFDKVVASNVRHLLDEPYKAVDELIRVCKKGGKVIIPTYINTEINSSRSFVLSGSILRKKKRADSGESAEKFTINLLTILYIFPIQYYIFHHNLDN